VRTDEIKEHHGRIVKTTGDGLLLEFASVVDAVRCAVEVQREMAERNADVPLDRRLELRMGINVGDIIKDGRDIFGDGVNVAARLEPLAERAKAARVRREFVSPLTIPGNGSAWLHDRDSAANPAQLGSERTRCTAPITSYHPSTPSTGL
jgi:hypothetical protein